MLDKIDGVVAKLSKGSKNLDKATKDLIALGIDARNELKSYLASKNPVIKKAVTNALVGIGGLESIEILLPQLKDGDFEYRKISLEAINKLAGQKLQKTIPDTHDKWVKAYDELKKWYEEHKVIENKELQKLVSKAEKELLDAKTKDSAIAKLSKQGQVLPHILPLFKKNSARLKLALLEVVKKINSVQVMSELITLCTDQDDDVKKAAQKAIELISGKKLPEPMTKEKLLAKEVEKVQNLWNKKQKSFEDAEKEELQETILAIGKNKITDKDAKTAIEKI